MTKATNNLTTFVQGRNEVRWRPGQDASLAPPCLNLRSFIRKQIYCIEESACDIVWTFRRPPQSFGVPIVIRRPRNCAPFPPSLRPCFCCNYFL